MQATTKEITRDEFFAAIKAAGFQKLMGFSSTYHTANLVVNAQTPNLIKVGFLITAQHFRQLYTTKSLTEALDYILKLNALMPQP
jgi:hypothetical protein